MLEKNLEIILDIIDMTVDGDGIGKCEGLTIFVIDAIVGDKILVGITKVKKNYAFGRIIKFITKSQYRIDHIKGEHIKCGGCRLQHMSYEAQLELKEKIVKNNLMRIGGFKDIAIDKIKAAKFPTHYRNKAQYPLTRLKDGKIVFGFYAPHSHRVIPNESCLIQSIEIDKTMSIVSEFLNEFQISIYEAKNKLGLVRHIVIREGHFTKEIMVAIVINGKKLPNQDILIKRLTNNQNVKSVLLNSNIDDTNVILGKDTTCIHGRDYIYDYIGDIKFKLSLKSFFQVNPIQTKILYDTAIAQLNLGKDKLVYDLYCGIGSIGLYLAKLVGKVVGIEIVPEAIANAKDNAKLNMINNAEFILGDAKDAFTTLMDTNKSVDIIILDPPRKGCSLGLIQDIINAKPKEILYISCDSATLSRDLKHFCQNEYNLVKVIPVDMFPHTTSIETIAHLKRVIE